MFDGDAERSNDSMFCTTKTEKKTYKLVRARSVCSRVALLNMCVQRAQKLNSN